MRNIAIIPARAGSKGLRDKNVLPFAGKPLLAWSIESALESGMFDEVMVSTDSENYVHIAKKYGATVPFLRSFEMSSDSASSWDVVREVLDGYRTLHRDFDTVCLLQPTSPLRTADDIVAAYGVFKEKKANSVLSVCESDHSPLWMYQIPSDDCMDHAKSAYETSTRQELTPFYRVNGAIYIVRVDFICRSDTLYRKSFAYFMPRTRSIDIDDELDFEIAEFLIAKQLV